MKQRLEILAAFFTALVTSLAGFKVLKQLDPSYLVLLAVFSPFAASLILAVFYKRMKDYSAYIGAFSGLISFLSILSLFGVQTVVYYSWIPSLGISLEFYIDGLSLLIATLASGIGVLVFLYSKAYMSCEDRKRKYYTVLTAFMGSMIGLVFSSNLIMLFMFWEFTSICSFLLISHSQRLDSAIEASKKSLLITVGSGLLLLLGFIILGNSLGTFSISEILTMGGVVQTLSAQGLYVPVLLLIGIGAAAKSAQVPLHIWLPDAMQAPTPVSAFLHSATMVKAGVFLIGRFRPVLMNSEAWNMLFITLGLLTMTFAAVLAVSARELKELLAYSTASHLGLIVAGFGFSSVLGGETATFHIFNHALFKASLFMVAGIILHETGTQKIKELSGLRKEWPVLSIIATVSGLSMAGLPLLNGFYSKELLFESAYHAASHTGGIFWILPVIAILGGVFTFLYSIRFVSVFYGEKTVEQHSIPLLMLLPPGLLALISVIVGFFPNRFIDAMVYPALHSVATEVHGMSVHVIPHITPAFAMSIVTICTGLLAYRKTDSIKQKIRKIREISILTPNFYYFKGLEISEKASDFVVENVETGLLRTYIIWVLVVASASGLAGFAIAGALPNITLSAELPVAIALATSVAAVYAVLRSDTYISSVLTLSILGFMVSIFYLLMDAPDLVMTQLVVESLSLIIFLLVLNKIPDYTKKVSFSRKYRDLLISASAGLLIFASVLYSTSIKTPEKLAKYFIENALPGSGGTNVVNVILVDFRGLDTMGEISVIVMAGIAILMLFRMRGEEK
ncbi:hydrogen gas-evolving membrane-bound hydrogenase subunit E [Candidatus Nanosalina sp. VS9-1]|uniref:hydrogen gas-evolving membrane-bound hydrogenase subunit E n=1 Tax=Candidatus Nanosalina sp. VS9-1 TaxID=3388566 RepID=UPI0039DF5F67